MSEENTTWEDSPVAQVYNPDGSQKEGAAEALTQLGYGDLSGTALRNGAGLFDGFKQHHEAKSQLTRLQQDKSAPSLKVPTSESSEDEVAAWREAVGALGSADDYGKEMWPEDLPDDFQKDEKMQSFVGEWASKHHIPTSAVKDLAAGFITRQGEDMQAAVQAQQEEANKLATETRNTITAELGGEQAYEKFANDAKTFLTSDAARQQGFDFKVVEDGENKGKLYTENPLHQAMLSDPAFLRMLKSQAQENVPFKIPGTMPASASPTDNLKRATDLLAANPNGFKSQADLDEYNALMGIKV